VNVQHFLLDSLGYLSQNYYQAVRISHHDPPGETPRPTAYGGSLVRLDSDPLDTISASAIVSFVMYTNSIPQAFIWDTFAVERRDLSSMTAQEKAYEYVKAKIIDRSFKEGDFLTEGEIAKLLGVSRTPIREAFLRLETENFLKLFPKKGALVPPVSTREIKDVMEARIVIELFSVEKLAGKCSQIASQLRSLLEEQARLEQDDNIRDFIELDRQFHHLMVSNCGNNIFVNLYGTLRERQIRMGIQAVTYGPERVKQVLEEHEAIVGFAEKGDVDGMKGAIRRHLEATMAILKEHAFA
jgi:DNA-binding GntR family transcriptional regulator